MPKKGPYLRSAPRPERQPLNRVREWRERAGWTQEELAYKSGLSVASISAYESGRNEPSVEALRKLGDAFGVLGGMILDVDPTKDPTVWSAYARATDAQRRDMGRAFDAMIGQPKPNPK